MKRPIAVTLLGCLFIVTGLAGLIYHMTDRPVDHWFVPIAMVRIIAVLGGIFLLLGRGWARWVLLVWLAFHVGVSAFHSISQVAVHLVLLIVIALLLLRPPASTYFNSPRSQ